jgi:hypothetical protein
VTPIAQVAFIQLCFAATIQIIRLPTLSQASATFVDAMATVSGFGRETDGECFFYFFQ